VEHKWKMSWTKEQARSLALRYGLALVSVGAALGVSLAFTHFNLPQPFGAFALSAIAITFWYAGTAPGIFAAVLSSIVRDYLFESDTSAESRILFDLAFLVFAFLMTRVARVRNQLELRVAERTAELTGRLRSQHTNRAKVSWSQSHLNRVTWRRRIPNSSKAELRYAMLSGPQPRLTSRA
jgi:K+-sensing histidine kinase KdpD